MKRVAITGYGIKVPGAKNNIEFEKILKLGEKQTELNEDLFPDGVTCHLGFVENSDKLDKIDKIYKRYPKFAKLAMETTLEALGLYEGNIKDKRVGVFFGTSLGGVEGYEEISKQVFDNEFKKISILSSGKAHYHSVSSAVAGMLGIKGPTKTLSTGCSVGIEAMEMAILYLKANKIDLAIVGASEDCNSRLTNFSFGRMKTLPFNQTDNFVGTPFTKKSKGFILSEGAGTLILEREDDCESKKVYGYIEDINSNNDAVNIFSNDTTGETMFNLLKNLKMKTLPDYINSQALGLYSNDKIEYINSRKLFNHKVPITSVKGIIGHSLGASGITQVISSLITFQSNFIFPIYTDKDGFEDLNIVDKLKNQEVKSVLITSHGYGGNNAGLYLSKE